ncbi:FkbM family methyltransferase [Pseudoxanthomonas beigongshangi]|uniref:FkbM family methyltransferase n=1 Tax=Pseudoxanthomonas beigongshangi TaxID=2782537 RepID=UPI00193B4586|nr:FkbM family methyltransferase [Pseudoxanthomonas beigongshangi]
MSDGYFKFVHAGKEIEFVFSSREDHIAKSIIDGNAFYEEEMLLSLAALLAPGDLVVDAGANIGNHSIFFAKCVGCRVLAFEPIEETFNLLQKNIALNEVQHLVSPRKSGLGRASAKARVASFDPTNIGGTSLALGSDGEIDVVSIDELNLEEKVSLLKVDVEGMDLDVLQGARKTLLKDRPWVVCEAATASQRMAISSFMAEMGYLPTACYNATDTYLFLPARTEEEKGRLTEHGFEEIILLQREIRRLQGEIRRSDRYSERLSREGRQYSDGQRADVVKELKDLQMASENELREELRGLTADAADARREFMVMLTAMSDSFQSLVERQGMELAKRNDAWMERVAMHFEGHAQSLQRLNEQLLESQSRAAELQTRLDTELRRLADAKNSEVAQGKQLEIVKATLAGLTQKLDDAAKQKVVGDQVIGRLSSALGRAIHALEAQEVLANSLSLQLGNSLLRAATSPSKAIKLPGTLLRLAREASARRSGASPRQIVDVGYRSQIGALRSEALSYLENSPISPALTEIGTGVPSASIPSDASVRTARLPSLPKNLSGIRMAAIMDEFTYSSYQHCCNVLQLTPSNWREELENHSPDILFIESAWRGKNDAWKGKISHCSDELRDIIDWCRIRRIPTIFWNKEDPVHFEGFIATASRFDHVFTTDIDCISRYKANLGHDRVYLLPFACQPVTHNPVEQYERQDAFCFAGAYYARFPERQRDLDTFIGVLREETEIHIYDRNHGKDDPAYKFPADYQPLIKGGLAFDQIDRAYKGYRYNINLNSVKQSQSMFARRVFDLLGCNTATISNFSLGLRLMFGDLVFTTDNGGQMLERLKPLLDDDLAYRRFRLSGLRKIMMEHTYQHRLEYVLSKVDEHHPGVDKPLAVMVARVSSLADVEQARANFLRQSWPEKHLVLVASEGLRAGDLPRSADVSVLGYESCVKVNPSQKWPKAMLAGVSLDDSYGDHYLTDMMLALVYSDTRAIGKGTYFEVMEAGVALNKEGGQYSYLDAIDIRCSVLASDLIQGDLKNFVDSIERGAYHGRALAVDEFHYLRGASANNLDGVVCLPEIDGGIPLVEILRQAESIPAAAFQPDVALPRIDGERLAQLFGNHGNGAVTAGFDPDAGIRVVSTLAHDKHLYLYMQPLPLDWWSHEELRFNLDVSTNVGMELAVVFLGKGGERTGVQMVAAGRNHTVMVPAGSEAVRFGLRVKGAGEGVIRALYMEHLPADIGAMVVRRKTLVLTNHYPSYDNLYRNGFVHRRVVGYRDLGLDVDVVCLSERQAMSHEFEGVDVRYADREMLRSLLESGGVESVLVHFLDEGMWSVIKDFVDKIRVIVWIHGAEVQPWHRREFNYRTEEEKAKAVIASDARMRLWREVFSETSPLLGFVFVSQYFANEVMEDVGIKLDVSRYEIIHNYIDEELFSYERKDPEQRFKVLSIRPFASAKYANDLSVNAIVELSKHPVFEQMSFHILGDGALFDETLQPLLEMRNVRIERRFLSQGEIAELHKQYGIFLAPTRMDSQGVSRDEAMASGLVPVTNAVTAIPEFVDETCGILAPGEDWRAMAQGILQVVQDPTQFERLSSNAARRVRGQSGFDSTIRREVALISLHR